MSVGAVIKYICMPPSRYVLIRQFCLPLMIDQVQAEMYQYRSNIDTNTLKYVYIDYSQ